MHKMDSVPLSNLADDLRSDNYGTTAETGYSVEEMNRTLMKRRLIGRIMSTTCHILIIGFTVYILYLSFSSYQLFSWHPSLMTVGALFMMAEAVMSLSPDNVLSDKLTRQGKVRMHWILQASAALCMFAGFLIIVINKNSAKKEHFQTLHAILGLITIILVGLTSTGGVVALYAIRLKKIVRPALIKLIHNILGIITFIIGILSVIFGLYSHWFFKVTKQSYSAQVICTVIIAMAAVLTLESAVKSAYIRFKALFLNGN